MISKCTVPVVQVDHDTVTVTMRDTCWQNRAADSEIEIRQTAPALLAIQLYDIRTL